MDIGCELLHYAMFTYQIVHADGGYIGSWRFNAVRCRDIRRARPCRHFNPVLQSPGCLGQPHPALPSINPMWWLKF